MFKINILGLLLFVFVGCSWMESIDDSPMNANASMEPVQQQLYNIEPDPYYMWQQYNPYYWGWW